ncbi:phosphoribosylformylglycinamidine synthase [Coemansia sp. RSA 2708]|nr:phosphoribosylformylglycinamidine synthase [Coemansia sp. RSA 2708]
MLHMPAVAEVLLPTAPENLVSDDQDPDFEKHELADKENELWVLPRRGTIRPWSSKATDIFALYELGDVVQHVECGIVYCIAFADDLAIPQFWLFEYKQINNTKSDRMAEPCTNRPRPLREAPIRSIEAAQAQGIAEQNEGMTINVLARTNHELGLALATDEIAYLVDVYLDMQATDAGIACNPTDAELMMFAQVNNER